MNWKLVDQTLHELLKYRRYSDGWLVDTTSVLPSGKVVQVLIRSSENAQLSNADLISNLTVSDNGAAIDEIVSTGIEISDAKKILRNYAKKYGLSIENGEIYEARVAIEELPAVIRLIATASQEAASREIDAATFLPRRHLRERLAALISHKYSSQFQSRNVVGKNRPHLFEYVREDSNKLIIIDPVLRDASSINAKVVAHLDVHAQYGKMADQLIVYDDDEHWSSDQLGILQLAASIVPWNRADDAIKQRLHLGLNSPIPRH